MSSESSSKDSTSSSRPRSDSQRPARNIHSFAVRNLPNTMYLSAKVFAVTLEARVCGRCAREAAPSFSHHVIFSTMYGTGVRVSEAAPLVLRKGAVPRAFGVTQDAPFLKSTGTDCRHE